MQGVRNPSKSGYSLGTFFVFLACSLNMRPDILPLGLSWALSPFQHPQKTAPNWRERTVIHDFTFLPATVHTPIPREPLFSWNDSWESFMLCLYHFCTFGDLRFFLGQIGESLLMTILNLAIAIQCMFKVVVLLKGEQDHFTFSSIRLSSNSNQLSCPSWKKLNETKTNKKNPPSAAWCCHLHNCWYCVHADMQG